jgi:GTPase SAR1 family protein
MVGSSKNVTMLGTMCNLTGFSIVEHLITIASFVSGLGMDNLLKDLMRKADVNGRRIHVMGAANVGKSSFINRLIDSSQAKSAAGGKGRNRHERRKALQRERMKNVAKATVSNLPGTTLDFLKIQLPNGIVMIDTPGLLQVRERLLCYRHVRRFLPGCLCRGNDEMHVFCVTSIVVQAPIISNLSFTLDYYLPKPQVGQLTSKLNSDELRQVIPSKAIKPITIRVEEQKVVMLGGLARIELLEVRVCVVSCTVRGARYCYRRMRLTQCLV